MIQELYFNEKRLVSWWQFITITRVSHMRVKIREKAIDRNWTMAPYLDLLDFIRLKKEDDYSYTYDYYPMKCTAKLEKIILQFVDGNHPQTRPDGDKWIEAFDEDDVGYIKGDPEYKYYDLSNIDLFNDTYITWHYFSESKTAYFSIFFKEEMVKDGLGWKIKVPMTPAEIQDKATREQGWYRY
jgi:hypothetical protein